MLLLGSHVAEQRILLVETYRVNFGARNAPQITSVVVSMFYILSLFSYICKFTCLFAHNYEHTSIYNQNFLHNIC